VRRLAAALRIDQFTDRVADSTALIARVSSRGNFGCRRDGIKIGGKPPHSQSSCLSGF
jgi:hypothetical protein